MKENHVTGQLTRDLKTVPRGNPDQPAGTVTGRLPEIPEKFRTKCV